MNRVRALQIVQGILNSPRSMYAVGFTDGLIVAGTIVLALVLAGTL